MEQNEVIEMQLWEYIDGICTDAEKERISLLIAQNPFWKEQYNELLALNKGIMASMETEQPSLRFSKNVMEAVSHVQIAPATKKYINSNIIKGIAAFFIITIASLLGYALSMVKWTSLKSSDAVPNVVKVNLSNIPTGNLFYIIVIVNILLGLLLLDTLVRRKITHHT